MNANLRNFALWVIIVLLLLALFTLFQNPDRRTTAPEISFSQFLAAVDQGRVRDVLFQGLEIHGTYTDERSFQTYGPNDASLLQLLSGRGVSVTVRPAQTDVPGSCRSWSRGCRSLRSSACGFSSRAKCRARVVRTSAKPTKSTS